MTPNLAFLACPTRSPFPKIAALAVLLASVSRAEIVNFDLDALPIQTGLFTSQTTPYDVSAQWMGVERISPLKHG